MSNEHTPGPWHATGTYQRERHAPHYWRSPVLAQGRVIAYAFGHTRDKAKANAALIVRAVNAHDALVAAVGRAVVYMEEELAQFGWLEKEITDELSAALALALEEA